MFRFFAHILNGLVVVLWVIGALYNLNMTFTDVTFLSERTNYYVADRTKRFPQDTQVVFHGTYEPLPEVAKGILQLINLRS